MELKRLDNPNSVAQLKLLIVPYGIETQHGQPVSSHQHGLLIVPYGIETGRVFDEAVRFMRF